MGTCWTCGVIGTYADQAANYVGQLSAALAEPMVDLFAVILVLWLVVRGIQIITGLVDIGGFVKEFVFVVAAHTPCWKD